MKQTWSESTWFFSYTYVGICLAVTLLSPPTVLAAEELSVAPVRPAFLAEKDAGNRKTVSGMKNGRGLGYVPAPVDLSHATGQNVLGAPRLLLGYPSSYDLRTQGKLTPVRDQGPCGSCWAFATYASMESFLLPGESRDFSENNLKNTHGFDPGYCEGGNAWVSTAYLVRWSGPVNEADDPYNPYSGTSPPGLPARKHVQEMIFLPLRSSSTDNDTIKQAIMTYGAVYTAFYWTDDSYNSSNYAYYYNGSAYSNHAVAIVGWDDNFDKNKFATTPPGNGAFIIKNSWGTAWGESGYFYISYYDSKLGREENAVFQNAEPTTNYARVYQYDPLGWVGSLGYTGKDTAWCANVFTVTASERVAAASFYTTASNASYELYVHRNPTAGPIGGTVAASVTGTIPYPGYHTVTLPSPVVLNAGDRFSVVLKLRTPGYNYPLAVEYRYVGYSSAATASPGQSYISSNGTSWSDLTTWNSTANACVKAFGTDAPPPTVTSITPNSAVNTGSVDISDLAGTGFLAGASVKLKKAGQTDIIGTNVTVVSSTKITCTFDLIGKALGAWDVVVTNVDGQSGTLSSGFTVNAPAKIAVHPVARDYGSVAVNSNADFGFTVSNTGSVTLDGSASIAAPFSVVGGSPYSIAGGGTATVTVRFAPLSTGLFAGTVTFSGGGGTTATVTGVGVQPDLVVSEITVTPSEGLPGSPATLTVTIANIGSLTATDFYLDTWFDRPQPPTCEDMGSETGNVTQFIPSLAPGASLTLEYAFNLPQSVGAFTARAFVDSRCTVNESNESNNQAATAYNTLAPAQITVSPPAHDYGAIPVGNNADFHFTVSNTGSMTLDGNASVEPPFSVVGGSPYSIAGGGTATVTVRFAPTNSGAYEKVVSFSGGGGTEVTVTGQGVQPDLAVTGITVTPADGLTGNAATLTVTIENIGSLTASNFRLDTWFVSTSAPGCGATGSVTEPIASLGPGASMSFSYPFVRPSAFGTYTARAFVDAGCTVNESDETNNQARQDYTVSVVDLAVSAITVTPSSGAPGAAATLTVTVKNQGSHAASNIRVDSWFERATAPVCGDIGSVTSIIGSLAAGATTSFSYPFNLPLSYGTYYARAFIDPQCAVSETNEANNQMARTYTVPGPDLTVSALTITPAVGAPGQAATLTVTIKNTGPIAASDFSLGCWIARAAAPVCGDAASVTVPISLLAAGASLTLNLPCNLPTTAGNYYARAFVDSQCVVAETSETNNQKSYLYKVTAADLTVTGMTVTPSSGPVGADGTLTVTIKNIGSQTAWNFRLDSWFASSGTPSCGASGSVTETIGSLAVGASLTFSYPFNFPMSVGSYTARAFADSQCAVIESNEANNQMSRTYTAISPDLAVIGLTVTPSAGPAGAAGTLTVTVKNVGSQTAGGFRLDSWFDRSTEPDCGDGGSVTSTIETLTAGASLTLSYPFSFPLLPGTYTAWSFADSQCVVAESNEANNRLSRLYTVRGPDLTVTGLTVTPAVGGPSTNGTLTVVIKNIGSLAATNFRLDSWFERGDAPGCGESGSRTETISSLAAGGALTFKYPFSFASAVGTYTACAFVDSQCVVAETNEANNRAAYSYGVSIIDLTISSITVTPSSGAPGQAATLTVVVKNQGSQAASNVRVDSWFERAAAPVCGDIGSVTNTISSLAAGATASFSYPFNLPLSYGTYYARAFIDPQCVVAESNEANNQKSRTYTVPGPDLTVAALTITPSNGAPGQAATLTVVIKNIGVMAASDFALGCWFARSSTPVCGETASVTETIGHLPAGASLTLNYPFTFPAAAGSYYGRAFVDSQCVVTETNETNNQSRCAYTVTAP